MRLQEKLAGLKKNQPAVVMAAYLLGVATHSFFPLTAITPYIWWFIAIIVLSGFLYSFLDSRRRRCSLGMMLLICFVFGLWRFDVAVPSTIQSTPVRDYQAIVQDVIDGAYGKQGIVKLKTSLPSFLKEAAKSPLVKGGSEGGFQLQLSLKTNVPIGSTINFSCGLRPLAPQPDESPGQFAAQLHKTQAQCSPKDLKVIAAPAWWDLRQMFADLRDWTNERIMSVLPGDEGALIAGMLYGERGMSQKSNNLFRRAGLTHLIAVSGSNITIVASIVFAILLGCGLWRRQAFWITTATLIAYVMFTGFSASVARAAIMGWLVLFARHIGRRPRTWHVLLVSAFVLCLMDPWMLGFDVGFALSFLASIGLMAWSPLISRHLKILPEVGGLREAAATTVSATLMTLPYSAFVFGRMTLAGLITNLIAVPLVPWAMLFGAMSAAWGKMMGWQMFSAPSSGVAKIIFFAAHLSDIFPWLSIPMRPMNFLLLVATYGLLVWIWFWLREEKHFSTENTPVCQDGRNTTQLVEH